MILLRYFNPIGAHKSGTIGENPNGIPNNLMPYVTQVAVGKLKELGVFGDDYDTPDGTGVRDYIHVVDLAIGHVKALKKIEERAGLCIYNLGTGQGYSVLDIVKNFEAANGVKIPYQIKPRRAGDIATCYSDATKAKEELGWVAERGIKEMCEDSWRWQSSKIEEQDRYFRFCPLSQILYASRGCTFLAASISSRVPQYITRVITRINFSSFVIPGRNGFVPVTRSIKCSKAVFISINLPQSHASPNNQNQWNLQNYHL